MTDALLSVRGIHAGYGNIAVLRDVSLEVAAGEVVTVIGANGAGKTTLLKAIAGLLSPTSGSVQLAGVELAGRPAERLVAAGVCLVPEGRQVFADLTVNDNLILGAYHRHSSYDGPAELERVFALFPQLAGRAHQAAGTLSGGEQQMLAIGRGLMSQPRLLLLDEPSLGLAPIVIREVTEQLVRLRGEGTPILLVEQNARAAFRVASRGYVLQNGQITASGSIGDLRRDPRVREAYLGSVVDDGPSQRS